MVDWHAQLRATCALSTGERSTLEQRGYIVLDGLLTPSGAVSVSKAYDDAVLEATDEDMRRGRSNTRVSNIFNHGPQFDPIFTAEPVLAACNAVFPCAYRLSNFVARTLHPDTDAQDLHVDYAAQQSDAGIGWAMVGFILMVDSFRAESGATVLVLGSHHTYDREHTGAEPVPAVGEAASLLLYSGSVWHGHGANRTSSPRRSIQGAHIRRDDFTSGLSPQSVRRETVDRFGPLEKYLMALPES